METRHQVEKWGIFELELVGRRDGNPYLDVTFEALFRQGERLVRVPGFYDGDGLYRVRFMPDMEGDWDFETRSTSSALDGIAGAVEVVAPSAGNHGPVRVRNSFHFAYDDGTAYFPFGTTCYAWTHQPEAMQAETLETLKRSGFNKIRMGVFPKAYPYNENAPLHDVFEPGPDGRWDFDRPNQSAFRHFEKQVRALGELGIEADVIIFHPYDRWGHADMTAEQDYRFVAYLVARLAAYRNVWWALANEYDFLLNTKPIEQWDRYFQIIEENDPYRHLASIHNGHVERNYDHRKPWVTHVCVQNWDCKRTPDWREAYGKPVVNDEPEYEGNIWQGWGNITAQELTHRFWTTVVRGGYAGHGETYANPDDLIWWAKGGKLHGEAWKRISFLRAIVEADVRQGLEPLDDSFATSWSRMSAAIDGPVRFIYFGEHQPVIWSTGLPMEPGDYEVDVIDTWEMTVVSAEITDPIVPYPIRHGAVTRGGKPEAAFAVRLPGKPYLALRVRDRNRLVEPAGA